MSLTNNESNRKLLNNPQIEPQKNSEFKQQAKRSKKDTKTAFSQKVPFVQLRQRC